MLLDQMITQQAQIIAYNNDFRLMADVVPPLLLMLLMRRHDCRRWRRGIEVSG